MPENVRSHLSVCAVYRSVLISFESFLVLDRIQRAVILKYY